MGIRTPFPDQSAVLGDFPYAMERYALRPALPVQDLRGEVTIPCRELDGFELHRDKFIPHAVIITYLETPRGETPGPI